MDLDQFCNTNSAHHRFGDDKMFNFTKPNGTVYNASFLNFLLRLIFLYLSATSHGNIDYYFTYTQNVIKTKSSTLLNFKDFEKPK